MARAFRRKGRGDSLHYVATLDADERDLVATLMEQVAELLEPRAARRTGDDPFDAIVAGLSFDDDEAHDDAAEDPVGAAGGPQAAPRDPALDRLLPTANRDDPAAAREFRRLTEGGLRHSKAARLVDSVAALREARSDDVELDPDQARAFVTALTDVRLVLGARLGLERDEDLEELEARADAAPDDDPLVQALALYDFLTWFQETLALALQRS